jgi:RimJ/RimL family protein N-acetyltransferase
MAELWFPVPPLTGDVVLLRPWREADVPGIVLASSPGNEASQHVAERCGFSREGLLRSHVPFKGARRDSVIYSLLPGELR